MIEDRQPVLGFWRTYLTALSYYLGLLPTYSASVWLALCFHSRQVFWIAAVFMGIIGAIYFAVTADTEDYDEEGSRRGRAAFGGFLFGVFAPISWLMGGAVMFLLFFLAKRDRGIFVYETREHFQTWNLAAIIFRHIPRGIASAAKWCASRIQEGSH